MRKDPARRTPIAADNRYLKVGQRGSSMNDVPGLDDTRKLKEDSRRGSKPSTGTVEEEKLHMSIDAEMRMLKNLRKSQNTMKLELFMVTDHGHIKSRRLPTSDSNDLVIHDVPTKNETGSMDAIDSKGLNDQCGDVILTSSFDNEDDDVSTKKSIVSASDQADQYAVDGLDDGVNVLWMKANGDLSHEWVDNDNNVSTMISSLSQSLMDEESSTQQNNSSKKKDRYAFVPPVITTSQLIVSASQRIFSASLEMKSEHKHMNTKGTSDKKILDPLLVRKTKKSYSTTALKGHVGGKKDNSLVKLSNIVQSKSAISFKK